MATRMINIAKDFSRHPAGRFYDDGPNNGERFRNEFLLPAINSNDELIVQLDGTRGYGSSFLEEAFGGLIRAGIPKSIANNIKIESADKSLIGEIKEYIAEAE